MKQVTVHAAKTHLSKLIDAALAGEEIIIAKGDKPAVRLVAIPQGSFRLGLLKDTITGPVPNFMEPMEDDELKLWEGES